MGTISRQLPKSNITRKIALDKASLKLSDPGPVGIVITSATSTRLVAITPLYDAAYLLVQQRQAELSIKTGEKNAAMQPMRLLGKHFIGVFNYGVERGKYPAAHRAYYDIDVNNANLPDLGTETQVLNLASNIVDGDPLRIAAGGVAMANPSAAEVAAQRLLLLPLYTGESNAQDALDLAQEALDALNGEADKVIKKVWDETETFFDEEDAASMRHNARKWGVVYVTQGPPAVLSGLVKSGTGTPRAGVTVLINETGSTATTDALGRYTVSTTVLGDITITTSFPGLADVTTALNIPDHDTGLDINVPDIVMA